MAELLSASNRVPGYDNSYNRPQPTTAQTESPQVRNPADPSRVTRADGRTEQQGTNDALQSNIPRYDSNLQTFLEQLRAAPQLSQVLARSLLTLRGMSLTPDLDQSAAPEIARLLQALHLDEKGLRQLFQEQVDGSSRFSGPLFTLLRQMLSQPGNDHARAAILDFVRRYSDYSDTGHIGNSMLSLLRQMQDYLPSSWRGQLEQLTAQLENGLAAGAREQNMAMLQQQIIPYLASYVERTHDRGALRALLNLLVLSTTRYENGSQEGMLRAFRQMAGSGGMLSGLNQMDDKAVLELLQNGRFARAANSEFNQALTQAAARALNGAYGNDAREAFADLIHTMLLSQSVYMPLNYMMVPVEWQGKMAYSQLWVDPDAQDEDQQGMKQPAARLLLRLDLESLGTLEITLTARDQQVDLQVWGPESVAKNGAVIARDLGEILKQHELTGKKVQVSERKTPLMLTQVFPDLLEGKGGVNVKI